MVLFRLDLQILHDKDIDLSYLYVQIITLASTLERVSLRTNEFMAFRTFGT